eukprot:403359933
MQSTISLLFQTYTPYPQVTYTPYLFHYTYPHFCIQQRHRQQPYIVNDDEEDIEVQNNSMLNASGMLNQSNAHFLMNNSVGFNSNVGQTAGSARNYQETMAAADTLRMRSDRQLASSARQPTDPSYNISRSSTKSGGSNNTNDGTQQPKKKGLFGSLMSKVGKIVSVVGNVATGGGSTARGSNQTNSQGMTKVNDDSRWEGEEQQEDDDDDDVEAKSPSKVIPIQRRRNRGKQQQQQQDDSDEDDENDADEEGDDDNEDEDDQEDQDEDDEEADDDEQEQNEEEEEEEEEDEDDENIPEVELQRRRMLRKMQEKRRENGPRGKRKRNADDSSDENNNEKDDEEDEEEEYDENNIEEEEEEEKDEDGEYDEEANDDEEDDDEDQESDIERDPMDECVHQTSQERTETASRVALRGHLSREGVDSTIKERLGKNYDLGRRPN